VGGKNLIQNGEIKTADNPTGNNPRSAIGVKEDGTVVIYEVDGRQNGSTGMTPSVLAQEMINIGCVNAINLDGGGSSRMLYEGKTYCTANAGNRAVDNVIAFYLKKEPQVITPPVSEPKTIYRVQVGAYSIKTNANAMLKKLQAAGYSDAYVRLIDGLYKVQVGAYSIKSNADKVLKDLKAKGFNGFIAK
jgi:hypothetical protein